MSVLDANVISELRKAKSRKANPGVGAWSGSQFQTVLFISSFTTLELETGVPLINPGHNKPALFGEFQISLRK